MVFAGDAWSGTNEGECRDAVHAAIDLGINMIDTAPIYGYGISEQIVGKALIGKRDQVIIATKCGLVGQGKNIKIDLSPESINKEINDSLRRLQVEYIDLYQCHWPDPNTPLEKTFHALNQIRTQGKIRHIGVSNFSSKMLQEACRVTQIATLQTQYSLLERSSETEILPWCREHEIGVLTYGSLAGGILTGKYEQPPSFQKADARSFFYKYYKGQAFEQTRNLLSALKQIPRPLNQIALNWVRQKPGISSVIAGCRNPQQVKENTAAAEWDLNPAQIQKINEILSGMKTG